MNRDLIDAGRGLLLDHTPARTCPDGVEREHIKVLKPNGAQVGTWIRHDHVTHAIHWRTAKGDIVMPPTLEALLTRCAS